MQVTLRAECFRCGEEFLIHSYNEVFTECTKCNEPLEWEDDEEEPEDRIPRKFRDHRDQEDD